MMLGQDLGWAIPWEDPAHPSLGPPEMHLLHFVTVRVSLAGVS